jgi:MATE family multidrug resistance protein
LNAGFVSSLCAGVIFFTPRSFLPSLFAPNEDALIEETGKTFTLLSIYVLGDGIQCALTGIIKGCGRQAITMPIVVISYWVIGLPLAYYLAFVKNDGIMCDDNYFCGNVGLVAGMTVGTWVHMILLGFVVFGTTDWVMEAKKVKARLNAHTAT